MDFDAVVARWVKERPKYEVFAQRLEAELLHLASRGELHASVCARAKDVHSFTTKIFRKQYVDPWAQITDKAGARVIVPAYTDVDRFVGLVEAHPDLEIAGEIDDKRLYFNDLADEGAGALRYSGVHFQLRQQHEDEVLECEVQVRTIAQDAWSVVSHKLVYKPAVMIPKEDEHAIFRLVALVELFDQEVKRVADHVEKFAGGAQNRLIEQAEAILMEISPLNSDRELSMIVMEEIGHAIPERPEYAAELRSFAAANLSVLEGTLGTYSTDVEVPPTFDWMMLGQAELLILMERLVSEDFAFQDAWNNCDLPNIWLAKIADILGIATPLLG